MSLNRDAIPDDWRQQKSVYPYKSLDDPKYIKDRAELFNENGNGWWWGWIKENTPMPGIYSLSPVTRTTNKKKGIT